MTMRCAVVNEVDDNNAVRVRKEPELIGRVDAPIAPQYTGQPARILSGSGLRPVLLWRRAVACREKTPVLG